MKKPLLFAVLAALTICLGACHTQTDFCTVKGTIKGVKDGTKLELEDAWAHFKVVDKAVVKDGSFEFHPNISVPTHVYLYTRDGWQLCDFILEPGTILVDLDANDEDFEFTSATGTASNETRKRIRELTNSGDLDAAEALMNEVLGAAQTGPLALLYANGSCKSSRQALDAIENLAPELAQKPFIEELTEELRRRVRTEPSTDDQELIPTFIDLEYPDADGNLVSLSSIVHNSDNRFVLLDFWATWCGPCIKSVPQLREIYAKYHDRGLEIYSVSEDQNKDSWKSYIKENGMIWVNVLDDNAGRKKSKAWYDYALNGIPTMLLIDGQSGEIIDRGNQLDLDGILSELFLIP